MIAWLLCALAGAAPLTLDTVLEAVDPRVPELAAAEAKLRQAEAKQLGARGSFDPVVQAKMGTYGGKTPRSVSELELVAPTVLGPEIAVGHQLGVGDFPIYDQDRATLPGGELRVRATVPLLDGLLLPEERAALLVATAGARLADAEAADKRRLVRRKAAEAFWKWAAAGEKLAIERELLAQASAREAALGREVEEGTRSRIDLLDNGRVVLQRRDRVAQAERELGLAALSLSLWYRDPSGAPIAPTADQLPPLDASAPDLPPVEVDRERVLARPDARAAEALLDAARVARSRARNALLPDLQLVGEVSRPVSPDGVGEVYGGAALKIPVLARKERGTQLSTGAEVEALEDVRRGTLDAARAEIDAARLAIEIGWSRVQWTREASLRAAEVVALEERRLFLGGGDLFQLLARESNLVAARKDAVDAQLDYHLALAARRAALADP